MMLLPVYKIKAMKTCDTLFVLACGPSISELTDDQWSIIMSKDSIAVNWFGRNDHTPTFYNIDEQGFARSKEPLPGHGRVDFAKIIRKHSGTTMLVKDRGFDSWPYYSEALKGYGCITKPLPKGLPIDAIRKKDFFDDGVYSRNNCIGDVVHFAVAMHYSKLVFVGVDLYGSWYFYGPCLSRQENEKHKQADNIVAMIRELSELMPEMQMSVVNPNSLLAKVIPVWNW